MSLSRRAFLGASAALGLSPAAGWAAPSGERRLVIIVLRGGMDGLHAVPPLGDPSYASARGGLVLKEGEGAVRLDSTFALHPALAPLAPLWQARELAVVHAVASPYRERSHFDGQDVLETGGVRPHALHDGWLNRAVTALGHPPALGVGQTLPLLLRGSAKAASWAPSPLPGLPRARIDSLRALYAGDPLLSIALEEGVQMEAFADAALSMEPGMDGGKRKGASAFPALAAAAGSLMAVPDGPRLMVMELGGWDTHSGQMGRMNQPLGQLAEGINGLSRTLGPAWNTTMVVAVSEFGRTVAENGTGGSDHGTGGAMILAGGAVAGGKVIADWPGLAKAQLHQGRDLRPTLDARAVFKAILGGHMGVSSKALDATVFPDSSAVRPVEGLVRG